MAALQPRRPGFESHSALFATITCWCRRCGIEMEVDHRQSEPLCSLCENDSNGILTHDLTGESSETLGTGGFLGVLRFTQEEDDEEKENGGVVNYFDCLGNNPEDFWIEEEEEIEQFEETFVPWGDFVISHDFYQNPDAKQGGENQSRNLWAEVDPGVFGTAVDARVSAGKKEDEDEVVFELDTLRVYGEEDEVDLFKSESDEFGLFRLGFESQTPGRGAAEEYTEINHQYTNSNPSPRSNSSSNPILNPNPNPLLNSIPNPSSGLDFSPRGEDSSDPFEWNSVAEDEICNSSSDEEEVQSSITDSESEGLCIACTSWESFGFEENNEENHEEWEELYGGEGAEVYSRPVGVEEGQRDLNSNFREEVEVEVEAEATGDFGWTSVFEDFRGIDFTYEDDDVDVDTYFGDPEDYADEAGYEVLMEQFAEANNFPRGAPPTSKLVVNSLPSIFIRQETIDSGNAWCPICKEVMNMAEPVKLLPCSHHYHGECILPWLRCRNSCPVCRFELPTDDPEYELQRKQVINQS